MCFPLNLFHCFQLVIQNINNNKKHLVIRAKKNLLPIKTQTTGENKRKKWTEIERNRDFIFLTSHLILNYLLPTTMHENKINGSGI